MSCSDLTVHCDASSGAVSRAVRLSDDGSSCSGPSACDSKPCPSESALVKLLHACFPAPLRNRRSGVLGGSREVNYFILGHFCGKSGDGISAEAKRFPELVRAVNSFLRSHCPDSHWTSVAIAHNQFAFPHRDSANLKDSSNISMAIGTFQDGGLLIECPDGPLHISDNAANTEVRAAALDNSHKPVIFSPFKLHSSLPWTGDRWVLNCYTLRTVPQISNPLREELLHLGFPVPPCCVRAPCDVIQPSRQVSMSDATALGRASWMGLDDLLCSWISREALPRLPCRAQCRGPILLITLLCGLPSVPIALAAMGLSFSWVQVEVDPAVIAASAACFHNAHHFQWDPFWLVLVVTASSCAPTRQVASRHRAPRAALVFDVAQKLVESAPTFWPSSLAILLSSRPLDLELGTPGHRKVSSESSVRAIHTDAAHFGHVSCPRAWCVHSYPTLDCLRPVDNVEISREDGHYSATWVGKPWPKSLKFDAGFERWGPGLFPPLSPVSQCTRSAGPFPDDTARCRFLERRLTMRRVHCSGRAHPGGHRQLVRKQRCMACRVLLCMRSRTPLRM